MTFQRGLRPFDPEKHARFRSAAEYGFTFAPPTYPIDKTGGLTSWGMDGNGPDPSVSGPFAEFASTGVGDCGPCAVPAHADMLVAALTGQPVASNTLTADALLTLYFTYEAHVAGATWNPDTPPDPSLDQGVDLGDWLLWLFQQGYVKGFVKIDDADVDAALDEFDVIVGGYSLTGEEDTDFENGTPFGADGNVTPDPSEGHAMLRVASESPTGLRKTVTWGGVASMTDAWERACADQWFAVLTDDEQVAALPGLIDDLRALGGTVAPEPAPAPAPAPPAPTPAPTPAPPAPTPPAPDEPTLNEVIAEMRRLWKWIEKHLGFSEPTGSETE